jgi:hypothetical protein
MIVGGVLLIGLGLSLVMVSAKECLMSHRGRSNLQRRSSGLSLLTRLKMLRRMQRRKTMYLRRK